MMHRFLCAKEQIGICGSVVDEAIALAALQGADTWLAANDANLRTAFAAVSSALDGGRAACWKWVDAHRRLRLLSPAFGKTPASMWPPSTAPSSMANTAALHVGPGHWFEQSDRFFRIGYGWPTMDELTGGLDAVSKALRAA